MTSNQKWRAPGLLLASTGISSLGDFIYLVAINLIVFNMTGSAAAVAGLWIVGPLTNIVMKFWTGSFIDYRSKRKVIITTYWVRALFIALIPFAPNVMIVYLLLILLSVAKSFFGPSSVTYITMLVPLTMRKRFNSIRALTMSGAFILGPALAGVMILVSSVDLTIWLTSILFVLAALLFIGLPDKEEIDRASIPKLTMKQVGADFSVVMEFVKAHSYVAMVYMSFLAVMLFTFAMDAQEVVFSREVVGLSEFEYSMLISITGIGAIVGGFVLSVLADRLSIRMMMTIGILMVTTGYLVYSFAWSFASIATGFIILGFFMSFLNSGIETFYQNNVPVEIMGRVTSVFELIQSAFQVMFVLLLGLAADFFSLREAIVTASLLMLVTASAFSMLVWKPGYQRAFVEGE
ncbi:MFS transporter [Jeotgalibacillus sp. R-1-5s-1]|uniref:MFS transporter n=1 Tax=Jeotgalibacillus sp. R-1-5s-1 TaxID=2555897 RepID=UPI00106981BE|nr:MFS transporter [Jeotgalibacillus sp. R-1-5s-1]TFE00856.1 MFS transporter [Jeotgalibacillus sp. R-1-5s-1]